MGKQVSVSNICLNLVRFAATRFRMVHDGVYRIGPAADGRFERQKASKMSQTLRLVATSAVCCLALLVTVSARASDATTKGEPPAAATTESRSQPPSFPGIIVGPAQPIAPPAAAKGGNDQPPGCPAQNIKPLELLV